ncbi:MAG: hypothetical protein Kow0029_24410 [Candidatus Rifleibacteriota bacterium]
MNRQLIGAIFLFLLVGCFLYLPKVTDNIGWYNSGEFVAAAITLDVPHAPGYPLLTRLGNLFLQLPISKGPAYRLNLLSCLIGLWALALMIWLLQMSGMNILSAFTAAVFLLGSRTYFEQAISIEVYCLEVALIIAGLMVGIKLAEGSESRLIAFMTGLIGMIGVGHRPTFALYALTLLIFVKERHCKPVKFNFFWFFIGVLLGAIPTFDLYLRLQNPARVLLDPMVGRGFSGLIEVCTGTVYGGGLFVFKYDEVFARFLYFFRFLFDDCSVFILPLALTALILNKDEKPVLKALVIIGMVNLLFVLNYNAFEAHSMLLPCLFVLCSLAGFALDHISSVKIRYPVSIILILSSLVGAFYKQIPPDEQPIETCKNIFSEIEPGSLVLMSNDVEFRSYYYLRLVQSFRKDVTIQLVDQIDLDDLKRLAPVVETHKVFGTLVYPEDALARFVASFSVIPHGYGYKILPAGSKPESQGLNNLVATIDVASGCFAFDLPQKRNTEFKRGTIIKYGYSYTGSVDTFVSCRVWAFLTSSDDSILYRNGLMIGHDCHLPSEFVSPASIAGETSLDLQLVRNLVIPFDIPAGNYKLNVFVEQNCTKLSPFPRVENVNLFNLAGFLEVFRLKYGLSNRSLIDKKLVNKIFSTKDAAIRPVNIIEFKVH